jgi:hypothetical protein
MVTCTHVWRVVPGIVSTTNPPKFRQVCSLCGDVSWTLHYPTREESVIRVTENSNETLEREIDATIEKHGVDLTVLDTMNDEQRTMVDNMFTMLTDEMMLIPDLLIKALSGHAHVSSVINEDLVPLGCIQEVLGGWHADMVQQAAITDLAIEVENLMKAAAAENA